MFLISANNVVIGGMRSFYEGILPMTAEAIFKVGIRYFSFQLFVEQYNETVHGDKKKAPTYAIAFYSYFYFYYPIFYFIY